MAGLSHFWQQLEWSSSSPKQSSEKALLEKEPETMALCSCIHITLHPSQFGPVQSGRLVLQIPLKNIPELPSERSPSLVLVLLKSA